MSSSTSASEPRSDARLAWRRWLITFVATFGGGFALLYALVVLIDPYDTGRFPGLPIIGTGDRTSKTAAASHGRDKRFNATVIGNSTGQLIDPYRLNRDTGLRFTQLAIAGTGPREQLTIMRWVIAHHPAYQAFVIVTDPTWCTSDPNPPLFYPFPFWLYGSNLDYLANVFSAKALDRAVYRIGIALGLAQPADPVGYFDYTTAVQVVFTPEPAGASQRADTTQAPPLPWVERLGAFLTTLPTDIRVVLAMPPVYYTMLPEKGTEEAVRIDACKAALARVASSRPNSSFIDFRVDNELVHDASDFLDPTHYRHNLAKHMEASIAEALRSREAGARADGAPLVAVTSQPGKPTP
ncbi:MAG TPA: hypothetical protein VFL55_07345 [Acetobacteraceae bacterium]|nr:hypothetical protein [Acetobacteraceae bacterium]